MKTITQEEIDSLVIPKDKNASFDIVDHEGRVNISFTYPAQSYVLDQFAGKLIFLDKDFVFTGDCNFRDRKMPFNVEYDNLKNSLKITTKYFAWEWANVSSETEVRVRYNITEKAATLYFVSSKSGSAFNGYQNWQGLQLRAGSALVFKG